VSASTGVMNSLLGKLTTLMGQEYTKLKGLRKEVKFITDELSCMNDLLERLADVEQLDPQTRGWRNQVRDMAYDIEESLMTSCTMTLGIRVPTMMGLLGRLFDVLKH